MLFIYDTDMQLKNVALRAETPTEILNLVILNDTYLMFSNYTKNQHLHFVPSFHQSIKYVFNGGLNKDLYFM